MEYYSAIKYIDIDTCNNTDELGGGVVILLSEETQTKKKSICYNLIFIYPRVGKSIYGCKYND